MTQKILQDGSDLELAFIWNRSKEILYEKKIDNKYILENLEECASKSPDLIVEVAHPVVVEKVNNERISGIVHYNKRFFKLRNCYL